MLSFRRVAPRIVPFCSDLPPKFTFCVEIAKIVEFAVKWTWAIWSEAESIDMVSVVIKVVLIDVPQQVDVFIRVKLGHDVLRQRLQKAAIKTVHLLLHAIDLSI